MKSTIEKGLTYFIFFLILIASISLLVSLLWGEKTLPVNVFQSAIGAGIESMGKLFEDVAGAVGGGFP